MNSRQIPSFLLAGALALACSQASAQIGHTLLPEGFDKVELGLAVVDAPRHEGSTDRQVLVMPSVRGNWSNGVFASLGRVGVDLSDDPTIGFGPLLHYGVRERRADEPTDSKTSLAVSGGAYAVYMLTPGFDLRSDVLYGGGPDRRGLTVSAHADYGLHLASHHRLTISPGVIWASSNYMESTFGIDSLQSQADGLPTHSARAGVKDLVLGVAWEWEINNRISLATNATALRLLGDAASSPLVKQRTNGVYSTTLSYRF